VSRRVEELVVDLIQVARLTNAPALLTSTSSPPIAAAASSTTRAASTEREMSLPPDARALPRESSGQ